MNTLYFLRDTKLSKRFRGAAWFCGLAAVVVAMFCLVSSTALTRGNDDDDEDQAGACTRTARAAFKACQFEVKDDYWIAIGNCSNLSAPNARAECKGAAQAAQGEGSEECGAQFEEREEVCEALGEAPYDPQINPSMFVDPAQIGNAVAPNLYFPLIRGRTRVYKKGTETVTVTVTGDTKVILGVTCAVIRDVVEDNGEVIEDTKDWYAQDVSGNVWYFGEIVQDFADGELVSIDGSFTAGVDGAKAGIIMKASPAVGDVYRQEFSLNNAEDLGKVLNLRGSATVPAASCNRTCLVTKDFTPLEPGVSERKFYAPGIGSILEISSTTGARLELVEIRNQP